MDKLVVVAPALSDAAGMTLTARLVRHRAELLALPADTNQNLTWRESTRARICAARRVVAVEPSSENDPDGRYRRELSLLYISLTAEQRARWLPCTLDAADREATPGPCGRSIGDIGSDAGANDVFDLAASEEPRSTRATADGNGCLVLHDHAVSEDGIGFQRHVNAFVDLISGAATTPPIVAAVEGGWGVGKSSFMNLVRRELRDRGWKGLDLQPGAAEKDPPGLRTVWFNAWSTDGEGAAFSGFALALIKDLEPSGIERHWCRLLLAKRRFNWGSGWRDMARLAIGVALLAFATVVGLGSYLGYAVPHLESTSEWLRAAGVLLTSALGYRGLKELWDFFGSPLTVDLAQHVRAPDHDAARSASERHYDDVARIIDVYTRDVDRLYVFIDDLDRADPAKVAEVTQAISVILAKGGKKVVYVLALDSEKVAAAIAARHKDIASVLANAPGKAMAALDFGRAYLEKLIQLSFRVPPASPEQLSTWTATLLNPLKSAHGSGVSEAVRMIASSLAVNPRRIKQFLNLLHLRMRLLPAESSLTCLQLGKITAAELLFPAFIRDAADAPALLNELLLGTEATSEAYRRWSAHTQLIELLTALPVSETETPLQRLLQDREASLLDLDIEPILRLVTRAASSISTAAPPASPPSTEANLQTPFDALLSYAREYERIRSSQLFTPKRTATLDRLFDDMARVDVTGEEAVRLLESGSPGERVAAVAACLRSGNTEAGSILARILPFPKTPFETYHALRAAKLVWPQLDPDSRRSIALTASKRWLESVGKTDAPMWGMTRDLLACASSDGPGEDVELLLLDGTAVRIDLSSVRSFDMLTDIVYRTMVGEVRPYRYGTEWRLTKTDRSATMEADLRHLRERSRGNAGKPFSDNRSLSELGIQAGARLRVRRLGKATSGGELGEDGAMNDAAEGLVVNP